jgi:hypothetical protein
LNYNGYLNARSSETAVVGEIAIQRLILPGARHPSARHHSIAKSRVEPAGRQLALP